MSHIVFGDWKCLHYGDRHFCSCWEFCSVSGLQKSGSLLTLLSHNGERLSSGLSFSSWKDMNPLIGPALMIISEFNYSLNYWILLNYSLRAVMTLGARASAKKKNWQWVEGDNAQFITNQMWVLTKNNMFIRYYLAPTEYHILRLNVYNIIIS